MASRNSAGSDGSSGSLGGHQLVGDPRQRVTVPMPKSIDDLHFAASRHFRGHQGLYHEGRAKIHRPHHVNYIKEGDVIVVAKGQKPYEAPPLTTHQDHFIKHPLQARAAPPPRQMPTTSAKFEGASNYHTDFVPHPIEPRRPAAPAESGWRAGRMPDPTGRSTYQQEFPWHDMKPAAPYRPTEFHKDSAPFEGATSYNTDYVKHDVRPRTAVGPQRRDMNPGPFEGDTTYNLDYVRHPLNDRAHPHSGYTATLKPDSAPFEGKTEYNREYLEHPFERRPMVHIEPELRRERKSKLDSTGARHGTAERRPVSAPADSVRRPKSRGQHRH
mmetsp:Transcript_89287/g.257531  ORF Transcript_89287/g.257531 Transcript_89287/m.257531 type:complete len:328 (-) Transcript_89287:206-1189(-)